MFLLDTMVFLRIFTALLNMDKKRGCAYDTASYVDKCGKKNEDVPILTHPRLEFLLSFGQCVNHLGGNIVDNLILGKDALASAKLDGALSC